MPINSNKIAKNTIILYFRMILLMVVSLYTSRVVLKVLGVNDYGIYNVVGGIVWVLGFLNGTLTTASARFITVSLTDNFSLKDRRTVFTSIFAVNIALAIIVIILSETVGLWFLYNKMQIPEERFTAAFWVYQMSVLTVAVNILGLVFNASIVAHEKMSMFAYLALFDAFAKLALVVLISYTTYDKLVTYAIAMLVIQILDRFFYALYCRMNFWNEIKPIMVIDKPLLKKMFNFIGWSAYGSFVSAGFTQGLNILLNLTFKTPLVNASRGISVQVQNAVVNFTNNLQMAINPQIIKTTAEKDFSNARRLLITNSKFAFYLLCLLSMPIIAETHLILNLWLDTVPRYAVNFCRIMLVISIWSCLASPLRTINQAEGHIRKFQLYECTLLLFIVPVSYFVLKIWQIPIVVFVVHFIFEMGAQLIRLKIVLPKIKMSIKDYFKNVYMKIIPVFIVPFPFIAAMHLTAKESPTRFVISVIGCEILLITTIVLFGISKEEMAFLKLAVKKQLKKWRKS